MALEVACRPFGAITWIISALSSIEPLGTNASEIYIYIYIHKHFFKEALPTMVSAKWQPVCSGFNELMRPQNIDIDKWAEYKQNYDHSVRYRKREHPMCIRVSTHSCMEMEFRWSKYQVLPIHGDSHKYIPKIFLLFQQGQLRTALYAFDNHIDKMSHGN